MSDLRDVSIKIRNYNCFGEESCGFEQILPINLIIGRNNSGKSSLLDLIEGVTTNNIGVSAINKSGVQIELSVKLTVEYLRRAIADNAIYTIEGKKLIGHRLTWNLISNQGDLKFTPPYENRYADGIARNLIHVIGNPFSHYTFKRLSPSRDVRKEENGDVALDPNGDGLTRSIHSFLNKTHLLSDLVEKKLLEELNTIFAPDAYFTRILVQLEDTHWEVYLEEEGKGRVALSKTGHGIKTILLVLAHLYLMPHVEENPLDRYIFGFEELENNLHPALQRRLLTYLRDIAKQHRCRFFFTTHSNVAIDLFANDSDAQIIHVTHDGRRAKTQQVKTYFENRTILEDLDVRASDLLQANAVVWVEGPSDKTYFNRWVELISDGQLKENVHYQCLFYGGSLLSHLDATPLDQENKRVKIFSINRNAVVMMDSDKQNSRTSINKSKKRIIDEVEEAGGIAWVTAGKTVENYIPSQALQQFYKTTNLSFPEQYEDFADYLNRIRSKEGEKFLRSKVAFAERIAPRITAENMRGVLDLYTQVETICTKIKTWNGRKERGKEA